MSTIDDAPPLPDLPPLAEQAERLISLDVPQLAGLEEDSLRRAAEQWGGDRNDVLMALSPQSAPASTLTAVLGWNGSRGAAADGPAASTTLDMVDVDEAGPAEIDIPAGAIYLVHDPDHGEDLKNLSPQEALTDIAARDRSPMLLTEALHWVLQQPEVLEQGHSSMMLGSLLRRPGGFYNQRVPALWSGHGTHDERPPHAERSAHDERPAHGEAAQGEALAEPPGQQDREEAEDLAAGFLGWRWWGSRHRSLGAATTAARTPVPSA